jgi:glycosyltransferase involved in cell wall biosynthesis
VKFSVSVIICCYTLQRLGDIREAVASVQRQTRAPDEIIVVVDNNRTLYDLLKEEMGGQARVILNEWARGLSAARNAGIAVAHGELVAFLDDDAIAEPDWLARLVSPFVDSCIYATGGRAKLTWSRHEWFPEELDWVVGGSYTWLPQGPTLVCNPHGHNMCFRRAALATIGMFSTALGRCGNGGQAGEERELCLRLVHRFPEAKIIYEPAAVVHHKVQPQRARWSYLIKRSYQEGLCKARIHQVARLYSREPLASEERYLRHLLFRAIPSRLIRFYRLAALGQVAAILLCIAATCTGYLIGRWRLRAVGRVRNSV